MTELSGTLEGVGLPAIVRFLCALNKTGCLRIAQDEWHGELFFDEGQVSGACLGSRAGLPALEAIIQLLPNGKFAFEVASHTDVEPNISLSPEALRAYFEELATSAHSRPKLPALDAVPVLVSPEDQDTGDEPLPLDRTTLRTLMAIDGRRTVREIIAQRGSLEALWQLSSLATVGLVRLEAPVSGTAPASVAQPALSATAPGVEELVDDSRPAQDDVRSRQPAQSPRPVRQSYPAPAARFVAPVNVQRPADSPDARRAENNPNTRRPNPWAAAPRRPAAPIAPPDTSLPSEPNAAPPAACPSLGFEDDSTSSFGRPTRLHRCFAAGAPLPLSLDQQRELCLSDEYVTCPRLTASQGVAQPSLSAPVGDARYETHVPEPEADDPRILRPPFIQRAAASNRGALTDRQAVGGAEPTRLRAPSTPPRVGAGARPTPLRARMERASVNPAAGVVVDPPTPSSDEAVRSEARAMRPAPAGEPLAGRIVSLPRLVIFGGAAVVVLALAVIGFLVLPQLSGVFSDDSVDPSTLPNSSAIAAGTPITAINLPRPTPGAAANRSSASTGASASASTSASASAASGAAAAPQPTLPPEPDQAAAPQAGTSAAQPIAAAAQPGAAASGSILDERFTSNARNWPSSPQANATLTNGSYRLAPLVAKQFVAISAPIVDVLQDVIVTADFHKLGGPDGGGYGIIVHDQGTGPLDGNNQNGRFYVLEAGDNGDVGIWRRDTDHWVDLLPWQHADAVKTGNATNELTVRATGNRLSLSVNGTEVAARTDGALTGGNVGLFVGGDGNQVSVDRFSVQQP
jgi:hypothetical protein